jgi:hypothetical protein
LLQLSLFLFSVVKLLARLYSQPQAFNYTKFYNPSKLTIAFPNALGLPSVYTLQSPSLIKSAGEVRLRSHPDLARSSDDAVQIPDYMNVTADIHVV